MDKYYMSKVRVSSAWYWETYCLKLLPEKLLSSDDYNNLKWAILGKQCACHLTEILLGLNIGH
jgi:hypothetical protein